MSRGYLDCIWLACLAVLFNVFAAPLAELMSPQQKLLVMWGGFCSAAAPRQVASELVPAPDRQHPMPGGHVCCCANAALLALPPAALGAFAEPVLREAHRPVPRRAAPARRRLWPSLNPRASPALA